MQCHMLSQVFEMTSSNNHICSTLGEENYEWFLKFIVYELPVLTKFLLLNLPSAVFLNTLVIAWGRSGWPRGLRRKPAAARLQRLRVRTPPEAWMPAPCECCDLSIRDLCVQPTSKSPTECGVSGCDLGTSTAKKKWPRSTKGDQPWRKRDPCYQIGLQSRR
jgi:hypothetical protein